jgi:uncharacterized membrane protein YeaQ/YmgE (transglycosylase-associated protein family)
VLLNFRQVGAFVSDAERASAATAKVGQSAKTAGASASLGAKGLLKYAAGAAAIYGVVRFIDKAITSTEELAKSTYRLQQQTGMSAVTSSEFLAATDEMGISSRQVSVSFQTLSKQIAKATGNSTTASQKIADLRHQIDLVAAAGGPGAAKQMQKLSNGIAQAQAQSVKAKALFTQLGVPLKDLRSHNTGTVLLDVADAFKKMKDPANRAADAQLLFGRAGYKLLPVLSKGKKGMEEWLAAQQKAGHYLTEQQVQANLKAIHQQKELSAAFHGLQTQLALALLPVLIQIGNVFMWFAKLLSPITTHANRLKVVIYGLVGALTAYWVTTKLATLWTERETYALRAMYAWDKVVAAWTWIVAAAQKGAALATEAWTAATWLLNAAWEANPVGVVILAIVALGLAFYEAYKHIKVFREGVQLALRYTLIAVRFVWTWIKQNWPLLLGVLLGPFGLAAAYIITHFGQVKAFVLGVLTAIRHGIQDLLHWLQQIPNAVTGAIKHIPGGKLALGAAKGIGGAFHAAFGQYGGMVGTPGSFVVGERGPELVSLPAGALIRPTPDTASVAAGHGRDLVIHTQVILDRKAVAQAVARVASDQLARRG